MEKKRLKMNLSPQDDLFFFFFERDTANLEKIINIPISDITDFPNHPFKVIVDDEFRKMKESIKTKGVVEPVIVREKGNGKYEMISGHRRKKASELLELKSIPCIVKNLTDEEATIIMVDSNCTQREKILPSERAFAYKMKLDALNHQGARNDLTSCQVGTKLSTAKEVGEKFGDSERQVFRYIRLTYLLPKLLEYVDNSVIKDDKKISIALSPAEAISFLTPEEQQSLLDYIDCNLITPSHAQAIELKNMSEDGSFTVEKMGLLLQQQKPNQTPKLGISMNRLKPVLPNSLKNDREREEYIIKAVEWYDKYQKRQKEKNSQVR